MDKKEDDFGSLIFNPLIKRALELLAEKHWFRFELKNIDRSTDRKTWKAISRWLRISRNKVEQELIL